MRCKQPAAHRESLGKFIFFFRNQKFCNWPCHGQGLPPVSTGSAHPTLGHGDDAQEHGASTGVHHGLC